MKRKKYASLIFVTILMLVSACASPSAPLSTVTPTSTPAPTVSPTPTSAVPANIQSMIDQFAQQYNIDPAAVSYISSEQVTWPDGCMGVVRIGYMCAMVVTPGYKIEIHVKSLTVELHTNLNGSAVLLAPLSTSEVQPLYLDWTNELAPCVEAQVSDQTLFEGTCSQNLSSLVPLTDAQKTQLIDWIHTYSNFVAETPNGTLAFYGQGGQFAENSIQNEIALWIDGIVNATPASSTASPKLEAISWQRSGGIAGFCDQVSIYTSGAVRFLSCKSNLTPQPEGMLTEDQLVQLTAWTAQYQSTQIVRSDNAVADGMTVTLSFTGMGTQVMPETVEGDLLTYVSKVVSNFY